MEIKLFGKTIFSAGKSLGERLVAVAESSNSGSKFLPDFYESGNSLDGIIQWQEMSSSPNEVVTQGQLKKVLDGKKTTPKEAKPKLTPKGVYDLQMLNDKKFVLNTDSKYVDEQIQNFKDKLALIKSEEYDMRRGTKEISSILIRMENRKKYAQFKSFFDEYAYTTSSRVAELVKEHSYLKIGQIAQFLADMPKEAVDAMKAYNTHTNELCGKQAVYYIIADKKDFEKSNTRRDPILLAQSPFGHVWQILGAWDKEMLFVEEL